METCPRRMREAGPWEHKEGLEKWEYRVSVARQCSFCGGIHPEDALQLLILPGVAVVPTDKSYKAYLRAPIEHREFKVYFQHFSPEQIAAWNGKMKGFHLDEDYVMRRAGKKEASG